MKSQFEYLAVFPWSEPRNFRTHHIVNKLRNIKFVMDLSADEKKLGSATRLKTVRPNAANGQRAPKNIDLAKTVGPDSSNAYQFDGALVRATENWTNTQSKNGLSINFKSGNPEPIITVIRKGREMKNSTSTIFSILFFLNLRSVAL
jgi:hypothetical protein